MAREGTFIPLSFIANVSSLALPQNAAEDIEHIYSPENHGRGYEQMLKKGHLSAFVSAIGLYPGREIRIVREKLLRQRLGIQIEAGEAIEGDSTSRQPKSQLYTMVFRLCGACIHRGAHPGSIRRRV